MMVVRVGVAALYRSSAAFTSQKQADPPFLETLLPFPWLRALSFGLARGGDPLPDRSGQRPAEAIKQVGDPQHLKPEDERLPERRCHAQEVSAIQRSGEPRRLVEQRVPGDRRYDGQPGDQAQQEQREHRDGDYHVGSEDALDPRLEVWQPGALPAADGHQAPQERPHLREEIRYAREIRQRPVAVEAYERHALVDDANVDQQHGYEQELPSREQVESHDAGREDQVEVETPEVRADPGPPAEPVVLGGVGVERRVDEVETEAHPSGPAAAVPQRRGVPELVEDAGDEQDPEHRED